MEKDIPLPPESARLLFRLSQVEVNLFNQTEERMPEVVDRERVCEEAREQVHLERGTTPHCYSALRSRQRRLTAYEQREGGDPTAISPTSTSLSSDEDFLCDEGLLGPHVVRRLRPRRRGRLALGWRTGTTASKGPTSLVQALSLGPFGLQTIVWTTMIAFALRPRCLLS